MKRKVYHYTRLENWIDIQNGSWKSKKIPGLGASKRLGKVHEEAFDTTAVWAFLDPIPKQWIENSDFPDAWEYLHRELGLLLLEIDVSDMDDVVVVDFAHKEGFYNKEVQDIEKPIPEKFIYGNQLEAEKAYLASRIPLDDYMDKEKDLNYSLPEVLIQKHVPTDRISISPVQPLLDERWKKNKNSRFGEQLIEQVSRIPELYFWIEKHDHEIASAREVWLRLPSVSEIIFKRR